MWHLIQKFNINETDIATFYADFKNEPHEFKEINYFNLACDWIKKNPQRVTEYTPNCHSDSVDPDDLICIFDYSLIRF